MNDTAGLSSSYEICLGAGDWEWDSGFEWWVHRRGYCIALDWCLDPTHTMRYQEPAAAFDRFV